MSEDPFYIVYPSWAERYLTLPWREIRTFLANPIASEIVEDERDNLVQPMRLGIIRPVSFSVIDGHHGGGLIVLEYGISTLQASALMLVACINGPEPIWAMWNMVGRPELPNVAVLGPTSLYRFNLRGAGLTIPKKKPPYVSFTLEYNEANHTFRTYLISKKPIVSSVISFFIDGIATLFTDQERTCRISSLEGTEYQSVIARFRPAVPNVVIMDCRINREVNSFDVAAVLYLLHWLADQPRIRLETCHMFGRFPGKPSFLPRMKPPRLR